MNSSIMTGICAGPAWTLLCAMTGAALAEDSGCAESARLLRYACEYEITNDFHTMSARCLDESESADACVTDAEADRDEAAEECADILEARLDLCEALDDEPHEPAFGPEHAADFVDPRE